MTIIISGYPVITKQRDHVTKGRILTPGVSTLVVLFRENLPNVDHYQPTLDTETITDQNKGLWTTP